LKRRLDQTWTAFSPECLFDYLAVALTDSRRPGLVGAQDSPSIVRIVLVFAIAPG